MSLGATMVVVMMVVVVMMAVVEHEGSQALLAGAASRWKWRSSVRLEERGRCCRAVYRGETWDRRLCCDGLAANGLVAMLMQVRSPTATCYFRLVCVPIAMIRPDFRGTLRDLKSNLGTASRFMYAYRRTETNMGWRESGSDGEGAVHTLRAHTAATTLDMPALGTWHRPPSRHRANGQTDTLLLGDDHLHMAQCPRLVICPRQHRGQGLHLSPPPPARYSAGRSDSGVGQPKAQTHTRLVDRLDCRHLPVITSKTIPGRTDTQTQPCKASTGSLGDGLRAGTVFHTPPPQHPR